MGLMLVLTQSLNFSLDGLKIKLLFFFLNNASDVFEEHCLKKS